MDSHTFNIVNIDQICILVVPRRVLDVNRTIQYRVQTVIRCIFEVGSKHVNEQILP